MEDQIFSVLILKVSNSSMVAPEGYLKNRKWRVASTTNLKEALGFLAQKSPQYILIPVDHPNKKTLSLLQLIRQAFPKTRIVPYADKSSGSSMKLLQDLNMEYNLYPPVSGPAIQRLILKIVKDDETRSSIDTGDDETQTQNAKAGSDVITFKGENKASGGNETMSFEAARAALSKMIQTDSDDSSASGSGGPIIQQGGMGGGDFAFRQDGPQGTESSATQKGPGQGDIDYSGYGETDDGNNSSFLQKGKVASGIEYSNEDEKAKKGSTEIQGNLDDDELWQKPDNNSFAGGSSKRRDGKTVPIMESEHIPRKKKIHKIISEYQNEDLANHSIIVRGTQEALNQSSKIRNPLDDEELNTLGESSHVACILVESERYRGYLVCALGKNKKVDKDFINSVQKSLFQFLKSQGEKLRDDKDVLHLSLTEVDFEPWAVSQAEFLRKSIHGDDEVALAFFPTQLSDPDLEQSASKQMLQLSLDELKDDTKVEFDLYIYMPENKKYLLYTPQGMTFYTDQKGRLKDKGIRHMHLKKDSAPQVKKYRAQNFLNEKIIEFQKKKK